MTQVRNVREDRGPLCAWARTVLGVKSYFAAEHKAMSLSLRMYIYNMIQRDPSQFIQLFIQWYFVVLLRVCGVFTDSYLYSWCDDEKHPCCITYWGEGELPFSCIFFCFCQFPKVSTQLAAPQHTCSSGTAHTFHICCCCTLYTTECPKVVYGKVSSCLASPVPPTEDLFVVLLLIFVRYTVYLKSTNRWQLSWPKIWYTSTRQHFNMVIEHKG